MVLAGVLLAWGVLLVALVHELAAALRGRSLRDRVLALVCLGSVFTVAWWLRATLPGHHVMYLDEPWYLEAARRLREHRRAELCSQTWQGIACLPYRKALGWPVLLALASVPGRDADFASLRLCTLLGALAAPAAAWVARCARVSWPAALLVGLAVAFHPLHQAWSVTGETHVPGALLLLVGMGLLLRAMETAEGIAVAGSCAAMALAASIRPEEGVGLLAAVVALATARERAPRAVIALCVAAAVLVAAGALRPMWQLNAQMSDGAFFSLHRMPSSVRAIPSFGTAHALAIAAGGCLIGLAGLARRKSFALTAALAGVIAPLMILVLCFDRFQERMLVGVSVAALPLAGVGYEVLAGTARWRRVLGLALMSLWIASLARASWHWRLAQHPSETQMLETRFSSRVAHEVHDGWLIAEWPTVYAASAAVPVMATHEALSRDASALLAHATERPLYFAGDMYCEAHFGGVDHSACEDFTSRYEMDTVFVENLHSHHFALLRVRGLRER